MCINQLCKFILKNVYKLNCSKKVFLNVEKSLQKALYLNNVFTKEDIA